MQQNTESPLVRVEFQQCVQDLQTCHDVCLQTATNCIALWGRVPTHGRYGLRERLSKCLLVARAAQQADLISFIAVYGEAMWCCQPATDSATSLRHTQYFTLLNQVKSTNAFDNSCIML